MLKLFHNARTARLVRALQCGDLDTLSTIGRKLERSQLLQPLHEGHNAIELCIEAEQPKALGWVLERHPDAATCATGALFGALRQPHQSLALLSALLKAGADANAHFEGRPLLHCCFEYCAPTTLMLHLSRLAEYGARLDDPALLPLALARGDRALIHFLIHSGAPLDETVESADQELLEYARRCAEDKRIRELMLR